MFYKVIVTLILVSRTYSFDLCDKNNSINISGGVILENGVILYEGVRYAKNEYYVTGDNVIMGCDCKDKLCLKKCCPFGFGYDSERRICVEVNTEFDPPVWNNYKQLDGVRVSNKFRILIGKSNCTPPEFRVRVGQASPSSHVLEDGSLYVDMPSTIPPWQIRSPDSYCIDTFVHQGPDGEVVTSVDALACFADPEEHHYLLSSTCMIVSCVFILATCAVYGWLPELRNLHGKVLMAYLMCLFFGFAFLASMQIMLLVDNISATTCVTTTIIIYFFLLSAFFWLNVMSFDIWWTFSGKRGMSLEKLSSQGRFYAYAAYAFSIPTALTILLAALEFSNLPPHPLLPRLRHQGCFISGTSKLIYLYGPIVILCVANMVFFVLTAMKITQIKQQTSVLKSKESSTHNQQRKDKQRLLLYIKLFVVMGINWILEVISAVYPKVKDLWRITDAYNVLIGLIIFIIFVCKRKIFHLMKKRYKQLRGDSMSRTQTTISSRTLSRDDTQISSIKLSTKWQP